MKAVITTDSISLRSRKMLFTFECPPDILINRSRPVHEANPFTRPRAATLSVAITSYTIIWGNFADNHINDSHNRLS